MGTGYTRNDTGNNIADGNVINASDLDGEFDAVQAAFNASTGHSHDGTTGEGPQIQTAGLADDAVTGDKIDSTTTITAAGFTGPLTGNVSGNVTGNADTATALQTARTIAGQSFDGTANISIAPTDLTGVTATAAEINALDGITSTVSELNLVDGSVAGTVVNSKAAIYGAAGALNATSLEVGGVAITATPAELNIMDGVTATTAEINKLDGVTATTAELNYTDGVTSNIQTQLDAMVEKAGDTMTGNLNFGDGTKAIFGAGSDLQIYHSGTHSYISDQGTGNLLVLADQFEVNNAANNENKIVATTNGAVTLYYDNSAKIATTSTGIDVTGTVAADGLSLGDNEKAQFGAGNDLEIYHDGSNSYIADEGTGNLYIDAANNLQLRSASDSAVYATFSAGGASQLGYAGSTKLATTSTGIDVTGSVVCDGATVDGAATGTVTTDNDLSFDMSATNNFSCTPTGTGALTFTNITSGQSGNIYLDNSGGHVISAAATTFISAADLTKISTAGKYFVSYYSADGTNVLVSASSAVTASGA